MRTELNSVYDDLMEYNLGSSVSNVSRNFESLDQKYPQHRRETFGLLKKRLVSFRKLPIINGSKHSGEEISSLHRSHQIESKNLIEIEKS